MEITRGELPRGFSRHASAKTRRQENTGDLVHSLIILQERSERMMEVIPARLRARHTGFDENGTPTFAQRIPITRDTESPAYFAEERRRLRSNAVFREYNVRMNSDADENEGDYFREQRRKLKRKFSQ